MSQTRRKQMKDMTKREIHVEQMQAAQNAIAQTQLKAADLLNQAAKKIKTLKMIITALSGLLIGVVASVIYKAYT